MSESLHSGDISQDDDICDVCEKYGNKPDIFCRKCRHGYHKACLPEKFRNEDTWGECKVRFT